MAKAYIEPPPVDSTAVFKADIFQGKVLFCTGGGSGICKGMTEAVVRIFGHMGLACSVTYQRDFVCS